MDTDETLDESQSVLSADNHTDFINYERVFNSEVSRLKARTTQIKDKMLTFLITQIGQRIHESINGIIIGTEEFEGLLDAATQSDQSVSPEDISSYSAKLGRMRIMWERLETKPLRGMINPDFDDRMKKLSDIVLADSLHNKLRFNLSFAQYIKGKYLAPQKSSSFGIRQSLGVTPRLDFYIIAFNRDVATLRYKLENLHENGEINNTQKVFLSNCLLVYNEDRAFDEYLQENFLKFDELEKIMEKKYESFLETMTTKYSSKFSDYKIFGYEVKAAFDAQVNPAGSSIADQTIRTYSSSTGLNLTKKFHPDVKQYNADVERLQKLINQLTPNEYTRMLNYMLTEYKTQKGYERVRKTKIFLSIEEFESLIQIVKEHGDSTDLSDRRSPKWLLEQMKMSFSQNATVLNLSNKYRQFFQGHYGGKTRRRKRYKCIKQIRRNTVKINIQKSKCVLKKTYHQRRKKKQIYYKVK